MTSESSVTVPAPALPPGRRSALVVATAAYVDPGLSRLRSPVHDVAELAGVLADPGIGGFDVVRVVDRPHHELKFAVEDFLAARKGDELIFVYLSCHGVRDGRGRLYFAATDTRKSHLASTGVESAWLLDLLDECRAGRQVVVLDCCFSGAFAVAGAKADAELDLGRRLGGQGRGRVVLTASRAGEYSFEGKPLSAGGTGASAFTAGLVEGLRTGWADTDNDGLITVEDAYDYACTRVGVGQTPQRWVFGGEGRLVLARSAAGVRVEPTPLPDGLRMSLESPYPEVRIGAVNTLGVWLRGDDHGERITAGVELRRVVETEAPRVASVARTLLGTAPDTPAGSPRPMSVKASESAVTALAFSRRGRALASANGDDGLIRLWSVVEERPLRSLRVMGRSVHALALSMAGEHLAVADGDAGVSVLSLKDGVRLHTVPTDGRVAALSFSPYGEGSLVVGGEDGWLAVHDTRSWARVQEWPSLEGRRIAAVAGPLGGYGIAVEVEETDLEPLAVPVDPALSEYGISVVYGTTAAAVWGTTAVAAAGHGKSVRLLHRTPDAWIPIPEVIYPAEPTSLAFSDNGRCLTVGCLDGSVYFHQVPAWST
ncbi:caspase, EACC1-associated type [Yinghuangia seranimata]|uniref:caspase, EACC1-associated type n=1 Tax=Yinghuangia seranimata TaxID=408067 RepID=UPI00248D18DF|nr:caspase family protein [Yinghuangia seranimata]MDI2130315.1 hypothetical protein [Yinghuangia seranimata]